LGGNVFNKFGEKYAAVIASESMYFFSYNLAKGGKSVRIFMLCVPAVKILNPSFLL
jgi:hypothetical protein